MEGECPKCLRRKLSGPPYPGLVSLAAHIKEEKEDCRGPGAPQSTLEITPKEPWLTLTIVGKNVDFFVDTGV